MMRCWHLSYPTSNAKLPWIDAIDSWDIKGETTLGVSWRNGSGGSVWPRRLPWPLRLQSMHSLWGEGTETPFSTYRCYRTYGPCSYWFCKNVDPRRSAKKLQTHNVLIVMITSSATYRPMWLKIRLPGPSQECCMTNILLFSDFPNVWCLTKQEPTAEMSSNNCATTYASIRFGHHHTIHRAVDR